MITIIKQPLNIHSADTDNWFYFQSDFRFAPKFGLRTNFVRGTDLLNSVLLPTNPDNLNVVNTGNILPDFVGRDPKPYILGASASDMSINYNLELSESFEGLYILGTSSVGKVEFVDVVNNFQILDIGTPSSVIGIEFVNGTITTPIDDIYVIGYATSSNGFVSRLELSADPIQSTSGITASVGAGSFGYIQFEEIIVYSIGATLSTSVKSAVKADIDYLPWNQDDDFSGFLIGTPTSQFQTRKKSFIIDRDEWMTLSFINSATVSSAEITDDLGATYSIPINIPQTVRRVDIPAGTANLNIGSSASSYTIKLVNDVLGDVSETIKFEIRNYLSKRGSCLPGGNFLTSNLRLMWLNDLGGWDFYTFKWLEQKSRVVERQTYQKNLRYNATKRARGFTSYKTEDYWEWQLVSDLVDDEVGDWVANLFTSDDVYLIYDNDIVPVQVLTDSYIASVGWESNEIRITIRLSRSNIK